MSRWLLSVLLLGTVPAAAADATLPRPDQYTPENVIRLHSLNSARLREIMHGIRQWRQDNPAAELHRSGPEGQQVDELSRRVEDLLYQAELMSMGLPFTNLNDTEMLIFKALGSKLYTEADELREVIQSGRYGQLEHAYARMDQTCLACHQMFRND